MGRAPASESTTYHLEFTLPATSAQLVIEPSARVPGIDWSFDGTTWVDRGRRTIDLASGDYGSDPSPGVFSRIDTVRSSQMTVPPTPRVELDRAARTAAVVSWQVLLDSAGVVLWEQAEGSDWVIAHTGTASDSSVRRGLEPSTTVCYRTALEAAPTTFSASACVAVPAQDLAAGYLEFTGAPGSYLMAPDFVTGSELDVRLLVAPEDWTPDAWRMFVGQFDRAVNDRAWRFGIDSFDSFRGNFSADGFEPVGDGRRLPDYFIDGAPEWIRMTIDTAAGLERFWVSDTGLVWKQWGDDIVYESFELHNSDGPVYLGTDRPASDNPFSGRLFYLQISVNGEVVSQLDLRTEVERTGSTFTDEVGVVWSGRGSGWQYVSAAELAGT